MARGVLLIEVRQKGFRTVNQPIAHAFLSHLDPASPDCDEGFEPCDDIPVGDVLIRRDESGYTIVNYRRERIYDRPLRTASEAERLAAEIVAPWQGRVRFDKGAR